MAIPALKKLRPKAPEDAPAPQSSSLGSLFEAAAITTAIGAAGLGIGTILGVAATRDVRRAESSPLLCGQSRRCTEQGYTLIERADAKALGSTIAFAVGGATLAAGVTLFVLDAVLGNRTSAEGAGLSIEPSGMSFRI